MQMDSGSPDLKVLTAPQMYNMDLLNGGPLGGQPAFPGQAYNGGGNKITLEQVDPSTFEDDSDDDDYGTGKSVKPGKKTKGRVKIKMEFIENKLRRYTTFSKRKTGIMKKAYELSTLTGTQVMLLVASETGHVYTFATRKLQPMITSESGKALIQTCLNSPDPPPMAPGQQQAVEQRMNPGGFEETELTYAVEEENGKPIILETSTGLKPVYTMSSSQPTEVQYIQSQPTQHIVQQAAPTQTQHVQQGGQVTMATVVQQPQQVHGSSSPQSSTAKTQNTQSIQLQLPGLPPGFILQPGTSFTMPVQTQQTTGVSSPQPQQQQQQQQIYRLPTQQIISSTDTGQQIQTNGTSAGQQAAPAMTPSVFMYQTPQGIVYAPATGTLQDKTIFNFQQPTQTLAVSQQDHTGQQVSQPQQIITIPVPVSLAGSPQVLQLSTADTQQPQRQEISQPTGAKKRKL